jgi:hypothetical protein
VGPTGGWRQRLNRRAHSARGGGGGEGGWAAGRARRGGELGRGGWSGPAGPRAWLGCEGRGRGEKEKGFFPFSNLFSK